MTISTGKNRQYLIESTHCKINVCFAEDQGRSKLDAVTMGTGQADQNSLSFHGIWDQPCSIARRLACYLILYQIDTNKQPPALNVTDDRMLFRQVFKRRD